MTVFHDVEQNTPEWLSLRCGRIGGSSIGKIMANYGKALGQPALDLAVKVAIEQITGEPLPSTYTNAHMDRGHEQEPIARQLYEFEQFCEVGNGGYFSVGDLIGVSPDGLVGDHGMIEIKSVIETVHFANKKRGGIDPTYKWQLFYELKVTGREWNDFVSFCATFPDGKRLFVSRIYAEQLKQEFNMIDSRMAEFADAVESAKKIILQ